VKKKVGKLAKKEAAGAVVVNAKKNHIDTAEIDNESLISELCEAGKDQEAIKLLKDKAHHQHRYLLEKWGRHFMKEGDFQTAVSLFEIVANLFPEDDKTFNALAVAWSMAGDQEHALSAMKRCVELDPKSNIHHFNLAKLCMLREEWEDAKTELEFCLNRASGQQLFQIKEYVDFCQQKIDFPVVDLRSAF